MKKKIIAALGATAVLLTSGCGNSEPAQTTTAAPAETTPAAETTTAEKADITTESVSVLDGENDSKGVSGFAMKVNGFDGSMTITRAPKKSTPMGDTDTWTIFIYLCGTDLESNQYSATGDIIQLANAQASDNVNFVIQTGGTAQWCENIIDASKGDRYIIKDNDLVKVDDVPLRNMGDPDTLADFLNWGIKTYPAEKMGLIFWDHGGGSITGACFDELNEGNSLSLSEINTALSKVYANMTDKFEFIGFDCCLMGTAETANILATYGKYFYGSQETEPGTGWDYTAISNFLAENTSANGAELGKVVTDSFYDECAAVQQESECTFTIIDLEKFDDFVIAFNDYSKALYDAAVGNNLAGIVRGVNNAENFGGNNKTEGYTNMVDIGGIVKNCASYADGSNVLTALDNCIVYNKNGKGHKNASGLSVYYPLQVSGSEELKIFSGVCTSPFYLSLVDMVATGYTGNGYDNQVFFTQDGEWHSEDCTSEDYDNSHFDYADEESDGESKLITFEMKPNIDENGNFGFKLDEKGLEYAADVAALIYMSIDENTFLELGETYDIDMDWENGVFYDNFDGYWLALPNGQRLASYIAGSNDECYIYTSPIKLNGVRTNLRIIVDEKGTRIEGAWDGINENGCASREVKKIKAGDKIEPIYNCLDSNGDESEYIGDAYTWNDGDDVLYTYLPEANYLYCFGIEDAYGDVLLTDGAIFIIDDEGNINFFNEIV